MFECLTLLYLAENDGVYSVTSSIINRRADVLMTYVKHDPELELQALYAVQAFVYQLQHPSGQ